MAFAAFGSTLLRLMPNSVPVLADSSPCCFLAQSAQVGHWRISSCRVGFMNNDASAVPVRVQNAPTLRAGNSAMREASVDTSAR
ncbi:hypothetical protein D3C78_1453030 [compost metagenome]